MPSGALLLTAGVDWQHDRAEVTVLGIGRGQRCRLVDYCVVDGDPSLPTGYDALDRLLQSTWLNGAGVPMRIVAVAIDGGNWTEMVAQYVKRCVGFSGNARTIATEKGYLQQHMYLVRGRSEKKSDRAVYRPAKTEVNAREKTLARSVGVWGVGTSVLKHIIYGWLSAAVVAKVRAADKGESEDIPARMIRFPGGRGEKYDPLKPDPCALSPTYYAGLTCEYFDIDAGQWIKPAGARNEPLDTLGYAYWAGLSPAVKVDTKREADWLALEAIVEPKADLFNPAPSRAPSEAPQALPAPPTSTRDKSPAAALAPVSDFGSSAWSARL